MPYLVVGLGWFAFLMLALKVRMTEPVFLWVWAHGTILEKSGYGAGFWAPRAILLAVYMAVAVLAWFLVELGDRDLRHVWRRAVLAWLGIQIVFCLIAAFLTRTGVLEE
jgi:hypothetical protein